MDKAKDNHRSFPIEQTKFVNNEASMVMMEGERENSYRLNCEKLSQID